MNTIQNLRLFSYKLTNDSGFAPNPFAGVMTLAACKPKIRLCKMPGDWIAGFTSGQLDTDPSLNPALPGKPGKLRMCKNDKGRAEVSILYSNIKTRYVN